MNISAWMTIYSIPKKHLDSLIFSSWSNHVKNIFINSIFHLYRQGLGLPEIRVHFRANVFIPDHRIFKEAMYLLYRSYYICLFCHKVLIAEVLQRWLSLLQVFPSQTRSDFGWVVLLFTIFLHWGMIKPVGPSKLLGLFCAHLLRHAFQNHPISWID